MGTRSFFSSEQRARSFARSFGSRYKVEVREMRTEKGVVYLVDFRRPE